MPSFLALAVMNWLAIQGYVRLGLGVLLCFAGFLRASEALSLSERDLIDCDDSLVIVLKRAKRGVFQKVVITGVSAVLWARLCRASIPRSRSERVVGCSYTTFNKWPRRATASLGFEGNHEGVPWSTHSLRRGGATELLRLGISLPDIMLHGRWLSARTAREYFSRGDVAIMQFTEAFNVETFLAAQRLSAVGVHVWSLI